MVAPDVLIYRFLPSASAETGHPFRAVWDVGICSVNGGTLLPGEVLYYLKVVLQCINHPRGSTFGFCGVHSGTPRPGEVLQYIQLP